VAPDRSENFVPRGLHSGRIWYSSKTFFAQCLTGFLIESLKPGRLIQSRCIVRQSNTLAVGSMIDYEIAITKLESVDSSDHGSASADLAAAVWSGRVPNDRLLDLLKNGKDRVRECIAWAVWDARSPEDAVELLLTYGSQDSSVIVRNYALKAWRDLRLSELTKDPRFLRFLNDGNTTIREKAHLLFRACEGANPS